MTLVVMYDLVNVVSESDKPDDGSHGMHGDAE